MVRTSGFHPDNMGSIPVGDVNETLAITAKVFCFSINYFYYDVDKDPSTTLRDPGRKLCSLDAGASHNFRPKNCMRNSCIGGPFGFAQGPWAKAGVSEPVLQDCWACRSILQLSFDPNILLQYLKYRLCQRNTATMSLYFILLRQK